MFRSREKDKLFTLLMELAGLLKEGGEQIKRIELENEIDANGLWKRSEGLKEKSQLVLNNVMRELDMSLITPIEREDILHLAERLAGTLSAIEACTARFDIYGVNAGTDKMKLIIGLICEMSVIVEACVAKLSEKKFSEMQLNIQKIYGQVEAAHLIERAAIKELFANYGNDPIVIIKHKEIYDYIYRVVKQQEKVAKVLGTIIMKNA